MTLESYDYDYFKNFCKEFDSLLGRKVNSATSLQARLTRPLTARELQEMHGQMSEEFPLYKERYLRRSNYKLLASLTVMVAGAILVTVGATSNSDIQSKAPLIIAGAISLGAGFIYGCLECDIGRGARLNFQERLLTGFNDVTAFAVRSSDPTNPVANWYSSFRARTLTGV